MGVGGKKNTDMLKSFNEALLMQGLSQPNLNFGGEGLNELDLTRLPF